MSTFVNKSKNEALLFDEIGICIVPRELWFVQQTVQKSKQIAPLYNNE